jgi:hypothetical protein
MEYAEKHGLTPEQARKAMLAEDEARKVKPPQ